MNEREVIQSAALLLSNAVRDLAPRFWVEPASPREAYSEMLAEHREHKAAVSAALSDWLHSHIFDGRLSEPVIRQCFWRVAGAAELLSVAAASLLRERPPQDQTAEGLLHYLLIETWTNTTTPESWFRAVSRGETIFRSEEP